jgi:hypothetical protein
MKRVLSGEEVGTCPVNSLLCFKDNLLAACGDKTVRVYH